MPEGFDESSLALDKASVHAASASLSHVLDVSDDARSDRGDTASAAMSASVGEGITLR